MNRKLISKAISNIDEAFIIEAMSPPAASAAAPERTVTMNGQEKRKKNMGAGYLARVAVAACLIFALAATAFAFNLWGIRDMLAQTGRELPEAAEPYIRHHVEAAGAEDWGARITESLADDSKIMVTVQISGGDKYILAPTDADPDTLAVNIGVEGELTLGEYAQQRGKKLLFVGASLETDGASGGHGSQHFEHTGDGEMTILVQADVWGADDDLICRVYAVDENWEKTTLDIPVQLSMTPSDSLTYAPRAADAIPGVTVGSATVTETPLGITVRFVESVTDEAAYGNIKRVEFEDLAGGEGGTVLEEDGNWYLTVSGCAGSVDDTLTAYFYDWEDRLIGEIVFDKIA